MPQQDRKLRIQLQDGTVVEDTLDNLYKNHYEALANSVMMHADYSRKTDEVARLRQQAEAAIEAAQRIIGGQAPGRPGTPPVFGVAGGVGAGPVVNNSPLVSGGAGGYGLAAPMPLASAGGQGGQTTSGPGPAGAGLISEEDFEDLDPVTQAAMRRMEERLRILDQQNAQLAQQLSARLAEMQEREAYQAFVARTPGYNEKLVEQAYYELSPTERQEIDQLPPSVAKRLLWAERVAPKLQTAETPAVQQQPAATAQAPAQAATAQGQTTPAPGETETPYVEPATPVPPSTAPAIPENLGVHSSRAEIAQMVDAIEGAEQAAGGEQTA